MNLALFLLLIGDYFQQVPLVNEPELTIWRFNRTDEERCFEPEAKIFFNIGAARPSAKTPSPGPFRKSVNPRIWLYNGRKAISLTACAGGGPHQYYNYGPS